MYYWAGSVYACQATFFAWANDVLRYEEDSLRAVIIASMNMGSNAVNAWWSIIFYGANFAPYFTRGMWAMIAVSIASKFTTVEWEMETWTNMYQWLPGQHCLSGSKSAPRKGEKERPSLRPLQIRSKIWIRTINSATPLRKCRRFWCHWGLNLHASILGGREKQNPCDRGKIELCIEITAGALVRLFFAAASTFRPC